MIKIKNNIIPFGSFKALNLFGILFYKGTKPSKKVVRHESIHTYQIIEVMLSFLPISLFIGIVTKIWIGILLFIFSYYLLYFIEYFIRMFMYHTLREAYRNISFEREAYNNEKDLEYLKNRKFFSWLKYIRSS